MYFNNKSTNLVLLFSSFEYTVIYRMCKRIHVAFASPLKISVYLIILKWTVLINYMHIKWLCSLVNKWANVSEYAPFAVNCPAYSHPCACVLIFAHRKSVYPYPTEYVDTLTSTCTLIKCIYHKLWHIYMMWNIVVFQIKKSINVSLGMSIMVQYNVF